jgi:hypothetical protein
MDPSQPPAGGPTRRRSFTPAQKLEDVAAYEAAVAQGNGGPYLRQEGLYSSQITEWRTLDGTTKTMFVPGLRRLSVCP